MQTDIIDDDDELDDTDDEVHIETHHTVQDLDDDEVDDDDTSLETDEIDEILDEHINDLWREIDELDEMRESSDADETDDNEAQQIIVVVYSVVQQDDEIDETDECDEMVDWLVDDDDDLIEQSDEADEIDESESYADEDEPIVIDEMVDEDNLENDETQSQICIDWFFTLANSIIIAFKPNDESDEIDEMHHIARLLEHHDDDTDESVDVDETDEMSQSLMWKCCRLEAWIQLDDVDENDDTTSSRVAVVHISPIERTEQIDDVRYANLFRI